MGTINKGDDFNNTNIGNYLVGLYYYVLDYQRFNGNKINTHIFQYCPTIQTLCYQPFLEFSDINVIECDLDMSYFKATGSKPKVYRTVFGTVEKTLGSYNFNQVIDNEVALGGYGESKLCNFPYTYYLLSDGINPPMVIQPQFINDGKFDIKVKMTLGQTSKYNIYITNYKKDRNGQLESIVNNVPLLFPIGSNAYNQYLMTQGNTFNQVNSNALMENDLNLRHQGQNLDIQKDFAYNNMLGSGISNVTGAIGSLLSGNLLGLGANVGGGFMTGLNYGTQTNAFNIQNKQNNEIHSMKEQQIEAMALATRKDLMNTPRTMKTLGNEALFSLYNNNSSVKIYRFSMTNDRKELVRKYFNRYGYKINKYQLPNLKSRKYFNYVKTVNCNIDSEVIPHEDILKLQNIFNTGVTFWHVDNGAKIKDYNQNNEEV